MDRHSDSDDISARFAVARGVAGEHPPHSRLVHTDIPEQLPVLPGESDLILQHIGNALASIFDQ
ncbi:MAG: hypothetical protein KYX69_02825 [Sphingomonas sp.]|uniref:hypothetical protein n=1 Tax=Sphingomonas sp. TaxID=28214 RepID=UPI002633B3F3|nr:hypothetical protein [Sphingomonas sp.]MDK2766633.1 hypothetical protein [Sphingomonas sp.]